MPYRRMRHLHHRPVRFLTPVQRLGKSPAPHQMAYPLEEFANVQRLPTVVDDSL